MTVQQLRDILADLPDELPVQVSIDFERGGLAWLEVQAVLQTSTPYRQPVVRLVLEGDDDATVF